MTSPGPGTRDATGTGVTPRILPFGDAALLVGLGDESTVANARRARALAERIDALRPSTPAIGEAVAAGASVLVRFDPRRLGPDEAAALLGPLLEAPLDEATAQDWAPGREHVIAVRYGGEDGPDLGAVAAETGMSPDAVVELHAATTFEVLFLGFAPGFAYLGTLPPALVVPRLATPRPRVPAGSVAIAGPMTAVYPQASPGGWRLIGRSDVRLFDPTDTPPARLRPGDRVRFVPA